MLFRHFAPMDWCCHCRFVSLKYPESHHLSGYAFMIQSSSCRIVLALSPLVPRGASYSLLCRIAPHASFSRWYVVLTLYRSIPAFASYSFRLRSQLPLRFGSVALCFRCNTVWSLPVLVFAPFHFPRNRLLRVQPCVVAATGVHRLRSSSAGALHNNEQDCRIWVFYCIGKDWQR